MAVGDLRANRKLSIRLYHQNYCGRNTLSRKNQTICLLICPSVYLSICFSIYSYLFFYLSICFLSIFLLFIICINYIFLLIFFSKCIFLYSLFFCHNSSENAENMHFFSSLALTLNEPEDGVAPTDSRLRPDQRLMEAGLWDEANAEKQRLEECQRLERRKREAQATLTLEEGKTEPQTLILFQVHWTKL